MSEPMTNNIKSKFQQEWEAAIEDLLAEPDIDYRQRFEYPKIESLIARAVDIEALHLACLEWAKCRGSGLDERSTVHYWIQQAEQAAQRLNALQD